MNDVMFQHLPVALYNIDYDPSSLLFWKPFLLFQQFLQVALVAVLLDDVRVVLREHYVEQLNQVVSVQFLHHVYFVFE